MPIKNYTQNSAEDIKKDFFNFFALSCKIRKKKEELEVIKSKLSNPPAAKLSDISKQAGNQTNRTLFLIQEKIEIKDEIKKLAKIYNVERRRLSDILSELSTGTTAKLLNRKPDILNTESSILRLRYFYGMCWDEINKALYGQNENFDLSTDICLKRVFRYHAHAFADIAKMIEIEIKSKIKLKL